MGIEPLIHRPFLILSVIGQFADRALRRFNLIALDSRFHGETTGKVGDDYTVVEAARDVAEFMASFHAMQIFPTVNQPVFSF